MVIEGYRSCLASPAFIPAARPDKPDDNQTREIEHGFPLRRNESVFIEQDTKKQQENDTDEESEKAESSSNEIIFIEGNSHI